jgi:hypothetical protein
MKCCCISTLISESQIVKYTTSQDEGESIYTSKVSIESKNEREEEYKRIEDMMFENFTSYLEAPLCIVDHECKYEGQIRYIRTKECSESIFWDSSYCSIYRDKCLRKDRYHCNNEKSYDKL